MSSIFDFVKQNKNDIDNTENKEKKKKSPFEYTSAIYKIIKMRSETYKDDLDELFKETDDNEYNFICWILNHNLVYNKILRENPDWFTGLLLLMKHKDYIYYYTKFMIDNNIKFPDFMSWYKIGIESVDKQYLQYLKDNKQFSEDEINELTNYCNEFCISIKDLCFDLISLDNIIITNKGDIF